MNRLFTLETLLFTALAGLLVGFSKTSFPSMGILAVTLMAITFPAKDSVGILLPMLIMGDIIAVTYYRRKVIWRHLIGLIPGVSIGLFIGFFVLRGIDSPALQTMLGILIISLVVLHFVKNKLNATLAHFIQNSRPFSIMMGSLAGFATMIGNASSGFMAIYLFSKRLDKVSFVGTGAWFYFTVNVIKVPFFISLGMINTSTLTLNAIMIPAIALGAVIGVKILKKVPEKYFQFIILALAVVGGLRLLFPA